MKILLAIAYLSYLGVPSIQLHEYDSWERCNTDAKAVYRQVKAGTVRAWCSRVGRVG